MTRYDDSWDRPHTPNDEPQWQESDAYWFYNPKQGVGGFHLVRQQPNRGTGQLMLFAFKTGGERFVLSAGPGIQIPLGRDARQTTKQVVGGHSVESLGGGKMRFQWTKPGCTGDLEFYEGFHEPRTRSKTGHSNKFISNLNADGHLECSDRLRGRLGIDNNTFDIDALAHPDRSWGFRDNSRASMHRYRMFSGSEGPELGFASFLLDLKGGQKLVAGYVARNGVDLDMCDLRVITTFDTGGLTPLSATGILTLENGEKLRIETKSIQGFMTPVPVTNNASQDYISTFEYQGQTGFLDIELCTNPGRGDYIPTQADVTFTAVDQGISQFAQYDF